MELPRVTQILKEAGLTNFDFVNESLLARAAAWGTAIHLTTKLDDLHNLDEKSLDDKLRPSLFQWRKFKKDFGIDDFVEIEKEVISKRYGFIGHLDRIFEKKNRLIVLDIKTSKIIAPVTGLQLAGYQIGYEEMAKKKIKERWAVSLQDDKYTLTIFDEISDRSVFLAALTLTNWRRKWKLSQ